ncbi:MAG: hypothetical protein ACE1ZS_10635 [Candidatus Poribacteria bacterium]
MLKAVSAIYKEGKLIFADKNKVPKDGAEVIVTFVQDSNENPSKIDAIAALRGRGKGEKLVEKLLQLRREDLEHDERNCRYLRS